MTGPGKSPSWKGARIAAYWPGGTPPRNTNVSVPRLTPDRKVRTTTSPRPGSGSVTGRISPRPGARSQNALRIVLHGPHLASPRSERTCRNTVSIERPTQNGEARI